MIELYNSFVTSLREIIKPLIIDSIKNMPNGWSKDIEGHQRLMVCDKLITQLLNVSLKGDYPNDPDSTKMMAVYANAIKANPDMTIQEIITVIQGPRLSVSIATYKESHQTTYHVVLKNNHQALLSGKDSVDENKIIPFYSTNLEHVNSEAETYAKLLEVPFIPLEVPKK